MATNDRAGRMSLSAIGQADLSLQGRHDRLLAELSAIGDAAGWTADRIVLGLAPKKPGDGQRNGSRQPCAGTAAGATTGPATC